MTIALPARAKLNLELEVVSRRDDGFHELRTTYQAIDLHDVLVMSRANKTSLTCSGIPLSSTSENSVLNAHRALEGAVNRSLPTSFHLHKRIPPGSGLGGASSDAAAALRGITALHQVEKVDLHEIASHVGADVPFFLHGGSARAEGRGERLTQLMTQAGWYAIAWPGIELSTAAVYGAWDEMDEMDEMHEARDEGPNHLRRAAEKVEPRLKEFAQSLGEGWQMTGSGSAFFRRVATRDEALKTTSKLECWTAVAHAVGPW